MTPLPAAQQEREPRKIPRGPSHAIYTDEWWAPAGLALTGALTARPLSAGVIYEDPRLAICKTRAHRAPRTGLRTGTPQ